VQSGAEALAPALTRATNIEREVEVPPHNDSLERKGKPLPGSTGTLLNGTSTITGTRSVRPTPSVSDWGMPIWRSSEGRSPKPCAVGGGTNRQSRARVEALAISQVSAHLVEQLLGSSCHSRSPEI
jgi:hypothetical protein